MIETYAALAPVFLLILLGWAVRAARLFEEGALAAVNRFGYFVLYPAFLFSTIAGADMSDPASGRFLAAVLAGFLAVAALTLALRPVLLDGPAFASIFQGGLRWNGFAILAAADAVFGQEGREAVALVFGPAVLLVNVLSVAALARWGTRKDASLRFVLAQIAGNPLVLACLAGIVANAIGFRPTQLIGVGVALELLGRAALPIALVCVGAGLDLRAAAQARVPVAVAGGIKLVIAPLVFYLMARAFDVGPHLSAVAVGLAATPTAAASYVLAREMGGDARLMAAIVSATTLACVLTMPAAIALAR
jgi:predicted permease